LVRDNKGNPTVVPTLPGGVSDYFYQYGPLHGDGKCTDGSVFKVVNGKGACNTSTGQVGYFGNKVLAVSYGGVLALSGYKGVTYDPVVDGDPLNSGTSWMRLQGSLEKGATSLLVERPVPNWRSGDEIVVTTTDYLPGHSEKLTIKTAIDPAWGSEKVDFSEQIQWPHNGVRYGGPKDAADKQLTRRLPDRLKSSLDSDPSGVVKSGAETRAAVALLSRSIRIVSEGDQAGETFDAAAARTECKAAQAEAATWSSGRASRRFKFGASNSRRWAKADDLVTTPSTSTRPGKHPPIQP
jgi:hypothetical protein